MNVGCKGVYITRACYPDGNEHCVTAVTEETPINNNANKVIYLIKKIIINIVFIGTLLVYSMVRHLWIYR